VPKPGEADHNFSGYWWDIRHTAGEVDPESPRAKFVDEVVAKYKALSRPSIAHPNDDIDFERAHAGRGGESRPYPDEGN
jgi:hypothetical protein